MKLKYLTSLILLGGSMTCFAQGYKDGIEYYKVEKYDNAKELLERNLNAASTDKALSYCYLGHIDFQNGNLAGAEANYNKGKAANASNPFNYIGLGQVALKKGDKKGAEALFKEARGLVKKDAKVEVAIARAYYCVDPVAYDKDIAKCIEKARKYDAKDPDSYIFEGDRYADKNDNNSAAGQYELAFTYDPNNTEAYVEYANVYYKVVPKVAIDRLKEFVDRNPQSALAHRELAEKYYELDLGGLAAEQYGKYIQNPNHFKQDEVRYVQLLFFGQKYQESYDLATKLVSTLPATDSSVFYMKRMQLYNLVAMEKWAEAEQAGEALFASQVPAGAKFQARDYTDYAAALKNNDKPEAAIAQYEKAVEMNPDKVDLMRDLSSTYTAAKNYEKAAKYYQMVIDSGNYTANDLYEVSGTYLDLAANTTDATVRSEAAAKARDYAAQANEKVPGNYRIVMQQAAIEVVAGNNAAADKFYNEVLSILDSKENSKVEYASTYKRIYGYFAKKAVDAKDFATAKQYYLKWLEVEPDNEALRKYVDSLK